MKIEIIKISHNILNSKHNNNHQNLSQLFKKLFTSKREKQHTGYKKSKLLCVEKPSRILHYRNPNSGTLTRTTEIFQCKDNLR